MKKFPHFKQHDAMDCGPTALRIVSKYYGRNFKLAHLRRLCHTTRAGSSLLGLSEASENLGYRTIGAKLTYRQLQKEAVLPCIAHWNHKHFVVVYKVSKSKVWVSDPAHGLVTYSKAEFLEGWSNPLSEKPGIGIVLLIEPSPSFYERDGEPEEQKKGFGFLYRYVLRYKKFLFQLMLGMLAGSMLQLIFPFLTQSIVDIGIQNQDIAFVYLILVAKLMLFAGRTGLEIIRSWIMLHLSTRINISMISDFFIKLMKLPINFFDVKMTGDIMQRIGDHKRIESFMMGTSLNMLFSFVNLIIFSVVLWFYSTEIFAVFFLGSGLYVGWILFFMKRRRTLDYKRFQVASANQSKVIELITGMQEIKLHNAERKHRWGWEFLQARLFRVKVKSLILSQTQSTGSSLINELKNIFITVLSAKLVIDGDITLGMMIAVTYIIGQLNGPIASLVGFIHSAQDARISLERLSEIHDREDEEDPDLKWVTDLPDRENIVIKNLSFRYHGTSSPLVLKNINLTFPGGKTTAIVGMSGSGKSTLMKLLLKFYEPSSGEIRLGSHKLNTISSRSWREMSGSVMQEGYIFSDTISSNIAVDTDNVDVEQMNKAMDVANIREFVESLPLRYQTKIGREGEGLSTGQKQRLLIARAVYKNPEYLFFDEATSALDANNEKTISGNLQGFLKGRTAVVIAHRLSTVKNADQIVVLDKATVAETGTHDELVKAKGAYYELVKNQLELD